MENSLKNPAQQPSELVSQDRSPRTLTVALVGNPNTGKSTLFNALTGLRQRIGNYPGVTVEKKNGKFYDQEITWDIIDLPGTYSLAPRSPDERVTLDVLLGQVSGVEAIDLVICVVDASNLRRNLYLASQVLELGIPTVLALTMVDVAQGRGETIDVDALSDSVQVPVISVHAAHKVGIDDLKRSMRQQVNSAKCEPTWDAQEIQLRPIHGPLPKVVYAAAATAILLADQSPVTAATAAGAEIGLHPLEDTSEISAASLTTRLTPAQWVFLRYLLDPAEEELEAKKKPRVFAPRPPQAQLDSVRQLLATQGIDWKSVESEFRYKWIDQQLPSVVSLASGNSNPSGPSWSDRIDNLLTHRIWGTVAFVVMMFVLFTAVFQVAEPFSNLLNTCIGLIKDVVVGTVPAGMFRSLITSGVLDGVGGVLVFLPQIFVLFFFIGVLEDSGYLARSAFLMDRWMSPLGLSGKSFIPLLSSFACAVPGILGTRVIDRPRDRLLTIMIAPLMSCSARLPVYIVFTRAFIEEQFLFGFISLRALVFISMYLVGVVVAALIALVCKRFYWRETGGDFFLELPSYKWPSMYVVVHRMWERGREYIKRAGTVILAMTILIWAANYFPRNEQLVAPQLQQVATLESQLQLLQTHVADSQADTAQADTVQADTAQADTAQAEGTSQSNRSGLAIGQATAATVDQIENQLSLLRNEIAATRQEDSYLGRAGKWIQPAVRPLGWDWKIGCAVLASFPAREVVIATLGILYQVGDEADEESDELQAAMKSATWADSGKPVFNVPVALSVMVFFALCSQCASTLAVIYHETRSWVWPMVSFVYMTTIAYLAAMAVYQVGILF